MPSWGWCVVGGVFLLGVSLGFGVAALVAGTANSELAQHNWKLGQENERLQHLVNTVTEEAL